MDPALEQLLTTVRTLSISGNFRELYEAITKLQDFLMKYTFGLNEVLEALDIQQHSLAYLSVLSLKFNKAAAESSTRFKDPKELKGVKKFKQAHDFIMGCNGEQIRFAPELFAELCHAYTSHLVETRQAIKGILVLQKAVSKARMFDTQLSSIHADLCQLCLLAKCFKPALQVLDVDINSLCVESGQANLPNFDVKYYLLYYYYGGSIYLAVRNLERALYFFEVCITAPAQAVSHIMLEAYKKYLLVSLLLDGKLQNIPKSASPVVNRFIKPLSQNYHDIANAFTTNNITELSSLITKHSEQLNRDHNLGLAHQVSAVLHKKNIQRLTKTFLTLSLTDVASRVGLEGPADAERHILSMIENKQIYATINQKDGMVIFKDIPEKFGGPDVLKGLEERLVHCMELDNRILCMDTEIQVNPQYVKKSAGLQDDEQPKSTYAM